jgi:PmbA protein
MTEDALAMEEAARAVPGVTNSSGAGVSAGSGGLVLVTSHGFSGAYRRSRFSRSVSVIAGEGTGMERDYDFSSKLFFADLRDPAEIGREAGERTARRVNPRKMDTQTVTAVFDPRVARGMLGHLAGAINGASVARKTSFLRDRMGQQVANAAITVIDEPARMRGQASRPFDGEGVQGDADDGRRGRAESLVPVDLDRQRTGTGDQRPRRALRHLGLRVVDQPVARAGRPDARKS